MVIGPGKGGVSAFVILADNERLPENLNDPKVVVMRRGESTNRELKVIKPLGQLADPELLKEPGVPVCNYSGDGNPLHEHADGKWWFYEETWAFENGPFESYEDGHNALEIYCHTVLALKENSETDTTEQVEEKEEGKE